MYIFICWSMGSCLELELVYTKSFAQYHLSWHITEHGTYKVSKHTVKSWQHHGNMRYDTRCQ